MLSRERWGGMALFLMMFDVEFVNSGEEGVPKPNMHYSPGVVPHWGQSLQEWRGSGRVLWENLGPWACRFIFSVWSGTP